MEGLFHPQALRLKAKNFHSLIKQDQILLKLRKFVRSI
jgi:hypothetical protein